MQDQDTGLATAVFAQSSGSLGSEHISSPADRLTAGDWHRYSKMLLRPLVPSLGICVAAVFSLTAVGTFGGPGITWLATTMRDAPYKRIAADWLDSQRRGESGEEFWMSESWVRPVRLRAVSSWEIVSVVPVEVIVRVDSSNGAGMPIRKLWKITALSDKTSANTLKISQVSEVN
jgi:hypothetical protein